MIGSPQLPNRPIFRVQCADFALKVSVVKVSSRLKSGLTLIEVLVVVIIMAVLVSIALPLYLRSVLDSEATGCMTNMSSIATATQAQRTRTKNPYYTGPVDAAATSATGPLQDLHNAVPRCPADTTFGYEVAAVGDGFEVTCTLPRHTFKWLNGAFVP